MLVEVKDAGDRYPWKRELIGLRGEVTEEVEKFSLVEFGEATASWLEGPVWFATECLEPLEEEEAA